MSAGSVELKSLPWTIRTVPPARDGGETEPVWTVTQTRPADTVRLSGESPTAMVATTRSLRGSMRDTVPSRLLATQTAPAPTAIPVGPAPTGMVVMPAPVAGSMRVTVPSAVLATQTAPAPTASALAPSPTGVVFVTTPARSMRETVSSRSSTTHVAPSPSASAAGSLPTSVLVTAPAPPGTCATAAKPVDAQIELTPAAMGLGAVLDAPNRLPTRTRRTTLRKVGSMRSAMPSGASIVHRALPSVVSASTLVPVCIVRTTCALCASICEMELSSRFATQIPSALAEMSAGRTPTAT
jgi:hypothetical protein